MPCFPTVTVWLCASGLPLARVGTAAAGRGKCSYGCACALLDRAICGVVDLFFDSCPTGGVVVTLCAAIAAAAAVLRRFGSGCLGESRVIDALAFDSSLLTGDGVPGALWGDCGRLGECACCCTRVLIAGVVGAIEDWGVDNCLGEGVGVALQGGTAGISKMAYAPGRVSPAVLASCCAPVLLVAVGAIEDWIVDNCLGEGVAVALQGGIAGISKMYTPCCVSASFAALAVSGMTASLRLVFDRPRLTLAASRCL